MKHSTLYKFLIIIICSHFISHKVKVTLHFIRQISCDCHASLSIIDHEKNCPFSSEEHEEDDLAKHRYWKHFLFKSQKRTQHQPRTAFFLHTFNIKVSWKFTDIFSHPGSYSPMVSINSITNKAPPSLLL